MHIGSKKLYSMQDGIFFLNTNVGIYLKLSNLLNYINTIFQKRWGKLNVLYRVMLEYL
jgi:hypothetical protein